MATVPPHHSLVEFWHLDSVEIDKSNLPNKRLTIIFRDPTGTEVCRLIGLTDATDVKITTIPALAINVAGPLSTIDEAPIGAVVATLALVDRSNGAELPASWTLTNDAGGRFAMDGANLVTAVSPIPIDSYMLQVTGTSIDNPMFTAETTIRQVGLVDHQLVKV
jgi:hypothetical protein